MAKKQTAGREHLGNLAPKFAELNDDVLFGEVWSREKELSPRDRSMITIAALFSAGLYPQLKAYSSRIKRRWSASDLCERSRLVSGMGQGGTGASSGGCSKYPDKCETLAWCRFGFVVPACGSGDSR